MNLVRPSRLELTALLDVLLILLIAWQARAPDPIQDEPDRSTESEPETSPDDSITDGRNVDLADVAAEIDQARSQLDETRAELHAAEERIASEQSRAEAAEARADEAEATRDTLSDALAQTELHAESSPNAQAALQEFLESRITLVEILVSGEQVREYRRYGAPSWTELSPPIVLIERRDLDGDGQNDPTYIGDFFARFADEVDNSLVQRGPDDDVFYLLIPDDDSRPTYLAADGLRSEARRNPHLRVFGP